MLQIAVLSNHLNGRDTHVRQIKVYGPRPYVRVPIFSCSYHSRMWHSDTDPSMCAVLQEPHPTPALPIHFKRVHHLLFLEMTSTGARTHSQTTGPNEPNTPSCYLPKEMRTSYHLPPLIKSCISRVPCFLVFPCITSVLSKKQKRSVFPE